MKGSQADDVKEGRVWWKVSKVQTHLNIHNFVFVLYNGRRIGTAYYHHHDINLRLTGLPPPLCPWPYVIQSATFPSLSWRPSLSCILLVVELIHLAAFVFKMYIDMCTTGDKEVRHVRVSHMRD